jgi:hypothetical protein
VVTDTFSFLGPTILFDWNVTPFRKAGSIQCLA